MCSRRKGENAQHVIDLSAALNLSEKEISTKNIKIESLEVELMVLRQDLTSFQSSLQELEGTNQLLKVKLSQVMNSTLTKIFF